MRKNRFTQGVGCCLLISLFLVLPLGLHAHGDLHQRIVGVTAEIKANPDSAYLYLKRGELLYQHEDYKKALKDFKRAEKRGYADLRLMYNTALVNHKLGHTTLALEQVNAILREDPGHVRAIRLKGQILFDSGQYALAAAAFEEVIMKAETTLPENFLEASQAWEKTDTDEGKVRAIAILNKGIDALGPLRAFTDRLVEISLRYGSYDRALLYQNAIIAQADRKEWAYYERAQTYLLMGDTTHAKQDLTTARQEIMKLPEHIRKQKSIMDLQEKITFQLKSLSSTEHISKD